MVRSYWIGPSLLALALTATSWGQGLQSPYASKSQSNSHSAVRSAVGSTNSRATDARPKVKPPRLITIKEPGKPPQRCRVLQEWKNKDGSVAYKVQALDTGEVMMLGASPVLSANPPIKKEPLLEKVPSRRLLKWGTPKGGNLQEIPEIIPGAVASEPMTGAPTVATPVMQVDRNILPKIPVAEKLVPKKTGKAIAAKPSRKTPVARPVPHHQVLPAVSEEPDPITAKTVPEKPATLPPAVSQADLMPGKAPMLPKVMAEQPKAPVVPQVIAEQPKAPVTPKVIAEQPKAHELPEVISEQPKAPVTPTVIAEQPKAHELPEVISEQPKAPVTPTVIAEQPKAPVTPKVNVEQPKIDVLPKVISEKPRGVKTPDVVTKPVQAPKTSGKPVGRTPVVPSAPMAPPTGRWPSAHSSGPLQRVPSSPVHVEHPAQKAIPYSQHSHGMEIIQGNPHCTECPPGVQKTKRPLLDRIFKRSPRTQQKYPVIVEAPVPQPGKGQVIDQKTHSDGSVSVTQVEMLPADPKDWRKSWGEVTPKKAIADSGSSENAVPKKLKAEEAARRAELEKKAEEARKAAIARRKEREEQLKKVGHQPKEAIAEMPPSLSKPVLDKKEKKRPSWLSRPWFSGRKKESKPPVEMPPRSKTVGETKKKTALTNEDPLANPALYNKSKKEAMVGLPPILPSPPNPALPGEEAVKKAAAKEEKKSSVKTAGAKKGSEGAIAPPPAPPGAQPLPGGQPTVPLGAGSVMQAGNPQYVPVPIVTVPPRVRQPVRPPQPPMVNQRVNMGYPSVTSSPGYEPNAFTQPGVNRPIPGEDRVGNQMANAFSGPSSNQMPSRMPMAPGRPGYPRMPYPMARNGYRIPPHVAMGGPPPMPPVSPMARMPYRAPQYYVPNPMAQKLNAMQAAERLAQTYEKAASRSRLEIPQTAARYELQKMVKTLTTSDYPSHREWAADQLSSRSAAKHPEVVQALMMGARTDPAPLVRIGCAQALVKMGAKTPEVIALVKGMLKDSDPRARDAAKMALSAMGQSVEGGSAIQPVSGQK